MSNVTLLGALNQLRSVSADDPEGGRFGDLSAFLADQARAALEGIGIAEAESLCRARPYERAPERRNDYRNGYRERTVQLRWTTLTIRVPRVRGGGFIPSFLEPDCRAVKEVELYVERAFLAGLSRIDVCRLMEVTTSLRPSERVLNAVQKRLDLSAKAFKERVLTDSYEYLFLDAAWVKDIVGQKAGRVCVLTAVGVTPYGRKEIIGFERVKQETQSAWRGFLQRLVARGLRPSDLRLVISDEHRGIIGAVPEVLGDVDHQYCWAHRVRNATKLAHKMHRKDITLGLRAVYAAEHRAAARRAWRAFCLRWRDIYPQIVESIEEDLRSLLAFYDRPQLHHEYVRTTNPIERLFLELRRRRFGCGAFANVAACDRTVHEVYRLLNELWQDTDIWMKRKRAIARSLAKARTELQAA